MIYKIITEVAEPLCEPDQPAVPGEGVYGNNIEFSYDNQTKVIYGIDFLIPARKFVALVGPSGAGKTTLARLIPRFWDVNSGSISLGDTDIRKIETDIISASEIFVLDKGKIKAGGTHEELLAKSGLYKNMWEIHISAQNWELEKEQGKMIKFMRQILQWAPELKGEFILAAVYKVLESVFMGAPYGFIFLCLNGLLADSLTLKKVGFYTLGMAFCFVLQVQPRYLAGGQLYGQETANHGRGVPAQTLNGLLFRKKHRYPSRIFD